jgi:hypothetical protein
MPETSLYPAVKRFLEGAGFCVKGEVNGCDAVAVQEGGQLRLAIVEMKLGFNLALLLQAMDRMRMADEVWLAVPATRRGRDRDPRVHRLCRAIGFGLMAVIGVKGIGEIGIVGMNAAIANAVYHATGKRLRELPIRAEQLL